MQPNEQRHQTVSKESMPKRKLTGVSPPADVVDHQGPSEHDQARLEDHRDVPPPHLGNLRDRDGEERDGTSRRVTAGKNEGRIGLSVLR